MEKTIVKGQIIDIEDEHVIILCRLDEGIVESRRFSREPFEEAITLEINVFIEIHITIEPGKQTIEYFELEGDHFDDFKKKDCFADLDENSAFLRSCSPNGEDDEPEDLFSKFKGSSFFKGTENDDEKG